MAHLDLILKRMLVVAGLLVTVSAAMGQVPENNSTQQGEWRLYRLESERLAVALPAPPALSVGKRRSDPGRKERLEQTLQASDGRVSFRVLIFENSNSLKLNDFVAEHNANNEWDIASERPIKVKGTVGKELMSPNKNAVCQLFIKYKRLYGFVATGAGPTDEAVKSFFSSIELSRRPNGIELFEVAGTTIYAAPIDDLFKPAEIDQKVRLLEKPEARYTERARFEKTAGTVVLKAVFTADGQVVNIRILDPLPHGLTEVSIEAARKIKFIPAVKDGKPVSVWLQLVYNFNLY